MRFYPEVVEDLDNISKQLSDLLNNGLTFEDNVDGAFVELDTTGAIQTVQHGLGRVPIGFFVIRILEGADTDPVGVVVSTADIQLEKNTDSWLLFVPIEIKTIGSIISFWAVNIELWTKEILFFRSTAKNLQVRLFVL